MRGDRARAGLVHAEGISDEELARAKESVKGRMVLSSESTAARMSRIGKAVLFDTDLLTLDEMLARVDAVSLDDVAELARELYCARSALRRRDRPGRGPLPRGPGADQRVARRRLSKGAPRFASEITQISADG